MSRRSMHVVIRTDREVALFDDLSDCESYRALFLEGERPEYREVEVNCETPPCGASFYYVSMRSGGDVLCAGLASPGVRRVEFQLSEYPRPDLGLLRWYGWAGTVADAVAAADTCRRSRLADGRPWADDDRAKADAELAAGGATP